MPTHFDKTILEEIAALPAHHRVETFGYGNRKILQTTLGKPDDPQRLSFGLAIPNDADESEAWKVANATRDSLRWWWLLREMGMWKKDDVPERLILPGSGNPIPERAGHLRNFVMLNYSAALIVCRGGRGTQNCFNQAVKLRVPIIDFRGLGNP